MVILAPFGASSSRAVGGRGPATARRWLVLDLPEFAIERLGHAPEALLALIAEERSAPRLVALSREARRRGLTRGMTAAEARAREPELVLLPHDPVGESEDAAALAEALTRLGEVVYRLDAAVFAIDASRSAGVFGGEGPLLTESLRVCDGFGHAARAAIADDWLAAWALCEDGAGVVCPPGAAHPLAGRPLERLRPTPGFADAARALGLRTAGDLARLDPASVAGRFGEEGRRLHRIARGQVSSATPPAFGAPEVAATHVVLGGPTEDLAPLLFVLPGLLHELLVSLGERRVVRLALLLHLDRGPATLVRARVGRPTRDAAVLLRLLKERLTSVKLAAPVVELGLEVEESAVASAVQPGLTTRSEAPEALEDLLARLEDALGEEALVRAAPAPSQRPEQAWAPHTWRSSRIHATTPARRRDPVTLREPPDPPPPRPSMLLPRPLGVEVRCEDGRPVALRVAEGWQRLRAVSGPEHLKGGWWEEDGGFDREYWVVLVGDVTAWLFHDGVRWHCHGWFD